MSKVDMKNTAYYQSGQHSKNAAAARHLATLSHQQKKQERIHSYTAEPSFCSNPDCKSPLPYEKRHYKFCCSSCAALFNNQRRPPPSLAQRQKQSQKLKGRASPNKGRSTGGRNVCQVYFRECKHCSKLFTDRQDAKWGKKTCSRKCGTTSMMSSRTYQNGSRKPSWYYNQYMNKEVLLDSSWEVQIATLLDESQIIWIRPDPIPWFDIQGKSHLYYPDFYLPTHNLYLDPKNAYCMEKDREKMCQVSQKVQISYGDISVIKQMIEDLSNHT